MSITHTYSIAKHDAVVKRVEELRNRSEDIKSRIGPVLKQLWNAERKLQTVQNLSVFADLKTRFPNFLEAIEYYESNAIAFQILGAPYEANPVLLMGEPGLGKTLFVSELAKVMGLPFFDISMNTTTAGFALSGGNIQWSEGSPGFIARSLITSPVANPIIMIDEVDKASGGLAYNPLNSLYSLLEKHSAKRFKDEALEIEIDASRITWTLTANDIERIPDPIMSRMKAITIRQPQIDEMPAVINSIYTSIRHDRTFGKVIDPELAESVIASLSALPPRQIRMVLEDASLVAIMHRRSSIQTEDIRLPRKEKRYGF